MDTTIEKLNYHELVRLIDNYTKLELITFALELKKYYYQKRAAWLQITDSTQEDTLSYEFVIEEYKRTLHTLSDRYLFVEVVMNQQAIVGQDDYFCKG